MRAHREGDPRTTHLNPKYCLGMKVRLSVPWTDKRVGARSILPGPQPLTRAGQCMVATPHPTHVPAHSRHTNAPQWSARGFGLALSAQSPHLNWSQTMTPSESPFPNLRTPTHLVAGGSRRTRTRLRFDQSESSPGI